MADTAIEWTGRVWNPVAGCSIVSPGCTNCYAMKMAARLDAMGVPAYAGLTMKTKAGAVWTGEVREVEVAMTKPLRWRKPQEIFVNSMSDLFHESVPDAVIDRAFAVMALSPRHTYQVLTKRSERMRAYLTDPAMVKRVIHEAFRIDCEGGAWMAADHEIAADPIFPLPNVLLGASVEDQIRADERREPMAKIAASGWATFVSYEPALGAVDWTGWEFLQWLICGGESGPKARPMHPDWARMARDFCGRFKIAFFFKQWGAWKEALHDQDGPTVHEVDVAEDAAEAFLALVPAAQRGFLTVDGRLYRSPLDLPQEKPARLMHRMGKKAAGRTLDGAIHDAMPGVGG